MTRISCPYWAECPPAGCCSAGVYTRPTAKLCEYCLSRALVNTRFGKVPPQYPPGGVGTELKKLLALAHIFPKGQCNCAQRAAYMDRQGVDWCVENIATIIGWLRDEAARRKLPFVDMAGKALVRLAISRARRAEKQP